ncbi:MAG: branched-chain amino acid ABC transporter permease [Anaerolineae bacterium]
MELFVQATINGLILGSIYALVALGLSLIWGVMNIVNFAHAEFLMWAMYATYLFWTVGGVEPVVALLPVVILFFGTGWVTYKLLVQRIIQAPMVSQIFATFGLLLFLRFLAFNRFGPELRQVRGHLLDGEVFRPYGLSIPEPRLMAASAAIVTFAGLHLFLTRTKTGKALQAVAQNRAAALSLGIDPERMFALAWGIGIASVAIAGVFLTTFRAFDPNVGAAFLLLAFASVVLGGFGTVIGALVGGLTIGLVENWFGTLVSPSFKLLFVFSLFVFMLLVRPQGLLGSR